MLFPVVNLSRLVFKCSPDSDSEISMIKAYKSVPLFWATL